jgi:TolB-like protein/Tfp pilus assembly protein PilF
MDIVGCSKLPSDEQKRIVGRLQELVRESGEFRRSLQGDQLISLPTGDGMALAFFNKLDAAVLCAIEITKAIQAESLCKIRMGVHTGPVFVMDDINGKSNISGAGINRAERVMSCGGDGHILLSDGVAESLRNLSGWKDKIRPIGDCQIKDGWVRVWNLVDGPVGNPAPPRKAKRFVQRRRLAIAAGGVALALLMAAGLTGAFRLGRGGRSIDSGNDTPSIAVLPFVDMSPEKNQEYFSDGLAEELLTGLSRIPGLRVAARTSSFQFKGKNADSQMIGNKLNVAAILEGSVRKQGNLARIAVQLISTADGNQVWSETFDREMNDIFAVQEEIAKAVTRALKVTLLAKKNRPFAKATSVEAYNAYLQGRYFLARRNKENLAKAVDYFEQAIKSDSSYAPAWVGLGVTLYGQGGVGYVPTEDGYRKAREAVQRALALDPDLSEAHAAMGWIQMRHDWDWAGADASYQRALLLAPENSEAIVGAANLAKVLGRFDESIKLNRRALEIDPLASDHYHNLGIALYYGGRFDEAVAPLKKVLELTPERAITHGVLGMVYLAQSHPTEALAEMEQEKHPAIRAFGLALAYHSLGRKTESDAALAELTAKFQTDFPYQIAEVYAFRGENARAFEWLERAYTERDTGIVLIKGDPLLKRLERDARLAELLKKLGLPV